LRGADAGYEEAIEFACLSDVKQPMQWFRGRIFMQMRDLFRSMLAAGMLCGLLLPCARAQQGPFRATPQRPSFTSDTSTTAPGTFEIEIGGSLISNSFRSLPTLLKFTPGVRTGFFHGLEFSVAADLITSAVGEDDRRVTQFGDVLEFVGRRRIYGGGNFSIALAPSAAFFLRNERGAKLGLMGIAAYSPGLNALVGNVVWKAMTHSSETNPRHIFDFLFDYSRSLGSSGTVSRFALFAGLQWTEAQGSDTCLSLEQGLAFGLRPDWVLDMAFRQVDLVDGQRDFQLLFGFTVNTGRPGRW